MATQTVEVQTELVELPEPRNEARTVVEPDNDAAPAAPKYDGATLLRLISAGFSFFVAGVNDGSTGALIPYFMRQYDINTTLVSIL
jgi:hypothetical protein